MMLLLRRWVGSIVIQQKRLQTWSFRRQLRRVRQVQREKLLEKLYLGSGSDFARRHHFDQIRTPRQFRQNVPLNGYDYVQPHIEQVKRGRIEALFRPGTRVLMFALTSGTTAPAKFLPVTPRFLAEYRRSWTIWGVEAFADHPASRAAYILQIASDWDQFRTAANIPCGNISGMIAAMQHPLVRMGYCASPSIAKIEDAETRYYMALRLAVTARNVSLATTANPSTLVTLAQLGDRWKQQLVRDIADGTLWKSEGVPATVRNELGRRLKARKPRRARELERIIERTGRLYPKDYWPELGLLAVWTGGSVGLYVRQLSHYFGSVPVRDHGLSASEGRMTIPFADFSPAGVLDVASHYYEFIPEEEHDSDQPTVLEAHELEEGRCYFIVVTTSGGLYRYDMHDLVRCVGFEGEAPVLEFLNKGAHFSSLTGEKLSEFHVTEAVRRSQEELDLSLGDFTLVPTWGDPPYYQLLLEDGDLPPGEAAQGLSDRVEHYLQSLNTEYREKRSTGRLGNLALHRLPDGTWRRFRHDRIARQGGSDEQYKHPCLVPDMHFLSRLKSKSASS